MLELTGNMVCSSILLYIPSEAKLISLDVCSKTLVTDALLSYYSTVWFVFIYI